MKNYYQILEVSFTANNEQIKKAYRIKAIKYHPDKHFGDSYFTQKFIEIKEAYDILSDESQRQKYDVLYSEKFTKETKFRPEDFKTNNTKTKEKEEEFYYNPHKSFYSDLDRSQKSSPQFSPIIDHWGNSLSEDSDFFKFPKNIGKIISGYTDLKKNENPATTKKKNGCLFTSTLISLSISAIIILVFQLFTPVGIFFCVAIPLLAILYVANASNKFKHTCNFIGMNGFAQFKCENSRDNIVNSFEIQFDNVTDFVSISQINKRNFNYVNTTYNFVWMNGQKLVKEVIGTHESQEGKPDNSKDEFWLQTWAERYWTVYLLDNMEKELEKNGFLNFNLISHESGKYFVIPYLELGIGYIKFKTKKGETIYNFNEIKKVYTKGTNLFIEHSNYEKKFFFFESGNKNGIPLLNLTNRQFFFRAMELLLGYKFN